MEMAMALALGDFDLNSYDVINNNDTK